MTTVDEYGEIAYRVAYDPDYRRRTFVKYINSLPYKVTPDQRSERWQGWQAAWKESK